MAKQDVQETAQEKQARTERDHKMLLRGALIADGFMFVLTLAHVFSWGGFLVIAVLQTVLFLILRAKRQR